MFVEDGGDGVKDSGELSDVVGREGHEDDVGIVKSVGDCDGVKANWSGALTGLDVAELFHLEGGVQKLGEAGVGGLGGGGGSGVGVEVGGEEVGVLELEVDIGCGTRERSGVEGSDREDGAELVILDVLEDVGAGVIGGDDVVNSEEDVDGEDAAEVGVVAEAIERRRE